jgi:ribosome modulation factor
MTEEPQEAAGAASEGADSWLQGLPRENCPYPPDAIEREEWLKGWDQAVVGEAARQSSFRD